ncbi:MAG TPA: baseplate J/gp47 family protein [Longimicrobium sp.]|nr:baseplate J/gp47 family protein [Longimicrobium sp.]
MSFQKRGFRDLYQALESDVRRRAPALTDWEEGSVVRSLFESFAYEMATLYEQMDLVYQAGFVDTATGPNLDRVVAVLGITRNEPDFATGEVTFERDPGSTADITIPVGTLVTTAEDPEKTPSKKAYRTIEEGRLPAGETVAEVKVQAEERGPEYTADSESVVVMPRPVPGVKTVRNRRPVRFLGREREGDEDLRERAKKALLASGRASSTSIENALLGLPGVRGVRVREDFSTVVDGTNLEAPAEETRRALLDSGDGDPDTLGRGVVKVYVDGLDSGNAGRLRERVDEVRAAGVFVILEPAVKRNVQATLRIEADPRVRGAELETLERQVRDAVIRFLDRQRMGQPLLFSQLTREVLDVKGVVDLDTYEVATFRDARLPAVGRVTLSRPAAQAASNLAIPARTELRTDTGQRFVTEGDAMLKDGETEITVDVRALRLGRDGELLRTGSAVAWEPVGPARLAARNDGPIRLRRVLHPAEEKRVAASLEERFVPDTIRVAAEPKTLAVNVQVGVAAPAEAGRDALVAALRAAVQAAAKNGRPDTAWSTGLSDKAKKAINARVDEFFTASRDAVDAFRARLSADLDPATRDALVAEVQAYFDYARTRDPVRIEEGVLRDRLNAVLAARLTPAEVEARLVGPMGDVVAAVSALLAARFPSDAIADALESALTTAADDRMAAEDAKVAAAQTAHQLAVDTLARLSTELAKMAANDPARAAKETEVTAARTAEAARRAELEAAVRDAARVRTEVSRELTAELARVPERVEELRTRALDALAAVGAPERLAAAAAGAAAAGPFVLTVRLRTTSFEGEVRSDAPYVEPTFVETPSAEIVFVHTRLVELAGTLTLGMPLTATDDEKRLVRAQVRQSVADFLDSLRPEENVDLDRIRVLAEAHEKVLRATFEPADALKERVERGTLSVGALEKVALSGDRFDIRG